MYIHPTADVQTQTIGEGTRIWQFVVILPQAVIGKNCNINCHCFIENHVSIGDRVTIKSGVYIWDGITIQDDVFVGPNVTFVNNTYPRSMQYPARHKGAVIEHGVSIGANATVLANVRIGKYALIGAGSVVTKDIPPYSLWVGNPARQIGFVTEEGIPLNMSLTDERTGNRYCFDEQQRLVQLST